MKWIDKEYNCGSYIILGNALHVNVNYKMGYRKNEGNTVPGYFEVVIGDRRLKEHFEGITEAQHAAIGFAKKIIEDINKDFQEFKNKN